MKRTLFNTMMGCLAALSLAGCGGSDSSTVPSESLISEGYYLALVSDDDIGKVPYSCYLLSDGTCRFYPHAILGFSFKGSWSAEFLGEGKFRITFSNFSKNDTSSYLDCEITFTPGPITLTITNMSAYRAGQRVAASFDKAPFNHTAGTECTRDDATDADTGLTLKMNPGSRDDLQ